MQADDRKGEWWRVVVTRAIAASAGRGANVVRIWWEVGVLDQPCYDANHGAVIRPRALP